MDRAKHKWMFPEARDVRMYVPFWMGRVRKDRRKEPP